MCLPDEPETVLDVLQCPQQYPVFSENSNLMGWTSGAGNEPLFSTSFYVCNCDPFMVQNAQACRWLSDTIPEIMREGEVNKSTP